MRLIMENKSPHLWPGTAKIIYWREHDEEEDKARSKLMNLLLETTSCAVTENNLTAVGFYLFMFIYLCFI